MEHSSAYIDFKKQLKETGKQKLDGYYPDLLYCINADERKEIEKDIWTYFVKKDDAGLAIFMPYLEEKASHAIFIHIWSANDVVFFRFSLT